MGKTRSKTLRAILLLMKKSLSPPFPDQHQEVPENCKGDNTDKNNVVSKETCVRLAHWVITRRLWLVSVRLGCSTSIRWKGCSTGMSEYTYPLFPKQANFFSLRSKKPLANKGRFTGPWIPLFEFSLMSMRLRKESL